MANQTLQLGSPKMLGAFEEVLIAVVTQSLSLVIFPDECTGDLVDGEGWAVPSGQPL